MASIQKRGTNSFLLVVEAGYDAKGKRIRRTKTIRIDDDKLLKTTKKLNNHLELELAKFRMEIEAGEYIAPEKMTLERFVSEWENKYAVSELGELTLDTYLRHLRNHILPYFGHMRLDQVKPIQVTTFLHALVRKDGKEKQLSSGTKIYIYRVLRNVFQRAVEWKIIQQNPVADVKRPRDTRENDINVYNEKEVEILFSLVQNEPSHWRVFTSLALAAGLRRGELLGLEWSHVDFEKGTLSIEQTIVRGKNGTSTIKGTKSRKSRRIISLPPSIMEELKIYNLKWKKEKMKMRDRWIENNHEWLFCNENGKHFYPTTPSTWWRRFTNRVEVSYIRLHDLRHTSATLLINQGIHAKVISERLGHADIRVTMDTYGHVLQTADKEAAQKLDGLFSQQKSSI
ncbi:site-specific integrase [Cytobacillus sp. IB215665]|uniref:tyrosine-type recombinase/integrase n=1 Tax=Cytobacillus sp. IB215665 TaxID=3097357 RepID=UPI002A0E8AFB|nr:site-specific integrase [Cytobacillus sp. IB215665]MDX8366710.1 site-specific integrase [Cytobacillus sp. IB215665]